LRFVRRVGRRIDYQPHTVPVDVSSDITEWIVISNPDLSTTAKTLAFDAYASFAILGNCVIVGTTAERWHTPTFK
ncbi:hypothetical protein FRC00_014177, partial [Tulasnella sp. 408]